MEIDRGNDQPKIRVVIRKRPINKKQLARGQQDVVQVQNFNQVKVRQQKVKVDLTKYTEEHLFKFDHAVAQTASNQQMYAECVKPMIQFAFQGAKITCFAYGQTGSGKTYTMNGDPQNGVLGMYYLGAEDIFAIRDKYFSNLQIYVSFYEIYCGKLFDLLNGRQQLQAREDSKQNVNIIGLTVKKVDHTQQFMATIAHGSGVRITSQNSTNADSSRSHAILQIQLRAGKKAHGKLAFIDLAGCERGADTLDQNKQTKIDGAQINKSLLALKQCIRALDQGKNHTPFRGSKLTMVLKDSFTGFCKTLMIGNIAPGSGSCQNTLNTLRYADRVKQLKKGGTNNEASTKQQKMARQLMLPRNGKAKAIVTNESDSEQQDKILFKDKNNLNSLNSVVAQIKQNQKKPKYIIKDQNDKCKNASYSLQPTQQFRKGLINNLPAQHAQPLKSVNNQTKKNQITRNKSVIGRQKLIGWTKNENGLNSQRGSFPKNNSMLLQKNKQSIGYLQIKPSLQFQNIDQWSLAVDKFKKWNKNNINFGEMSSLFEEMVKMIMKQQVQLTDYHRSILMKEDRGQKQLLGLYQQSQMDNKNNGQMMEWASRVSQLIQNRAKSLNQLKIKCDLYQKHLKQHEFCQAKLFEAGENLGQINEGHMIQL